MIDPASASVPRRRMSPWAAVPGPTPGSAESIGVYHAGCLRGGQELPPDGRGYQAVRLKRGRHFGHPALVDFIEALGTELSAAGEPAVLVGDMGLPRGGPTLSSHASHQTGLDADLWYWRPGRRLSAREREAASARMMISKRRGKLVSPQFGDREISLLRRVAEKPSVDRVLVNYRIKAELCRTRPGEEWIRKIRPWNGHDHHFHVRLRCPAGDRLCQAGPEIPAGNGCDDSLAWWMDPRIRAMDRTIASEKEKPQLPQECVSVLNERSTMSASR
jgi:penicillin-insensitive murein endopeptidase